MHMHVSLPSVLEPLKQGYLRRWPHCQWPSYLLLAVCPDTKKIPRYTIQQLSNGRNTAKKKEALQQDILQTLPILTPIFHDYKTH